MAAPLPCRIRMGRAALLAVARRRARSVPRASDRRASSARGGTNLAGLTTHVLDVTRGGPAQGVRVELYEFGGGPAARLIADVLTNADGRTDTPLISAELARAGRFELVFHAGDYFRRAGRATRRPAVPRRRPDPLRRRRPAGALSCAAARLAVELFDLSGKLRRRTEGWVGGRVSGPGGRERRLDVQGTASAGPTPSRRSFGFSWRVAVSSPKLPLSGVGFPWILSSESRLINGLRGIFAEIFSRRFFPPAFTAGDRPDRSGMRNSRIYHGATLTQFLLHCNPLPLSQH